MNEYASFVTVKTIFGEKVPVTTKEEYKDFCDKISITLGGLESKITALEEERNSVPTKGSPEEEKSALEVLDGMKYNPDYDLGLYDTIINMGYRLKEHREEIDKAFKSDKSYYIAFGRSVHLDDIIPAAKEAFLCAGYNPSRYNFEQYLYKGRYFVEVTSK